MKNFFLKHFLCLQFAIQLLKIESIAVKIFGKENVATIEINFRRIVPIEVKKQLKDVNKLKKIFLSTPLRQFKPEIAIFCARNP